MKTLERPGDGVRLLVVLSAPSGAGKTTICRELLAARDDVVRVVTCTTRPPRAGERPGVDYVFLSEADFRSQQDAGAFLEHAEVYGHHYGTRKEDVRASLASGRHSLLAIDVQGAASVRAVARDDALLARSLVTVLVAPRSLAELGARLRGRAQDSEDVIVRRLAAAGEELRRWREFDHVFISGTIEEDQARIRAILDAEVWRTSRRTSLEVS